MNENEIVSDWLRRMQQGEDEAARLLFDRYFGMLVAVCRQKLGGRAQDRDEEDLALSAFDSFFRRAADGQFPQLESGDDIEKLLRCVAVRKVLAELRRQNAGIRGQTRTEASISKPQTNERGGDLASQIHDPRSPQRDVEIEEVIDQILSHLDDAHLREIFLLRLDGHSVKDIAANLALPARRVEYLLAIIRRTLQPELARWLSLAAGELSK